MNARKSPALSSGYIWLLVGCVLLVLAGLRWSVPVAVWLAPVTLIRFYRTQDRWYKAAVALPFLVAATFVCFTGSWDDLGLVAEIGLSALIALPLVAALCADRLVSRRIGGTVLATLVYPAVYVVIEFLLSLSPVGTSISIAVTQFDAKPLLQLASVTGIWGIPFLIGWFASTVNALWEPEFNLKQAARPVAVFVVCFVLILTLGGARLALAAPSSETVRIGAVAVEQQRDYWAAIIDLGTPEDRAHAYDDELQALEEGLFAGSERAARQGAKVVFWSEANAILHPDGEGAFLERAAAFAKEHQVYFVPAVVVLKVGQTYGDNKLVMIEPSGEIAYTYVKTKSWYQTDSDGIIRAVDTPYGRIATAICFDMDFPAFIRQAAKKDVDIMLVPAFDWQGIKSFHTQVGLLRAVENGFSAVRQVNEGTSMAVDAHGNVLAYQDFFTTADRVMIADLPTQGVQTVYGALGDWFAYAAVLLATGTVAWAILRGRVRAGGRRVAVAGGQQIG